MRTILFILITLIAFSCAAPQQLAPAEVQDLTPEEFKRHRLSGKTLVVDVRTPEEYATGHLEGAINSDFRGGEFAEEIKTWNKNKVYYLYCASGNRSGKAAELMKEAGFQHIYNVGAYQSLREAGFPVEQGDEE